MERSDTHQKVVRRRDLDGYRKLNPFYEEQCFPEPERALPAIRAQGALLQWE